MSYNAQPILSDKKYILVYMQPVLQGKKYTLVNILPVLSAEKITENKPVQEAGCTHFRKDNQ